MIYQLSQDSKQILNLVSNDILKILNKHVVKEEFMLKLGQLVYVIDFLQEKNPYSILGALGRVTHIAEEAELINWNYLTIKASSDIFLV